MPPPTSVPTPAVTPAASDLCNGLYEDLCFSIFSLWLFQLDSLNDGRCDNRRVHHSGHMWDCSVFVSVVAETFATSASERSKLRCSQFYRSDPGITSTERSGFATFTLECPSPSHVTNSCLDFGPYATCEHAKLNVEYDAAFTATSWPPSLSYQQVLIRSPR
ncbi:hypothetical protein SMACR_01385 [Sordaria macrospora]|uniref:WGS project CABT00000000 data, contig 2.4 n=2 Tax=Sordaria macrospora TaxID=5147 RepID=F7VQN7_SORMK|nr:uncharacterized protein SMAC_01385 [Sordaria macrospora k-hell]KAA8623892.1 hypothetical protein SMACR_01385 [Sordaria macrospora]KAH7634472.1 hypothetical protein B0T09DRAFT_378359 [Sordaria sp. MPI-SDFR-AT-0083]CCC07819.1 unnamed protein product [Sordaria macrospora k-hell]